MKVFITQILLYAKAHFRYFALDSGSNYLVITGASVAPLPAYVFNYMP